MATIMSQGPTGDGYDVRILEAGQADDIAEVAKNAKCDVVKG